MTASDPAGRVERLVVVGASLAGLRAVEAARRRGHTGSITLVGAEQHLPYDRPPLSKAFLDEKEEPTAATFRTEEHLRDHLGVHLVLGTAATGLDPDRRSVLVGDREIGYDALVIATGATARRLSGTDDMRGVHVLRTVDDAQRIREGLDAGARTVVVGAGFIGSEVASAARKRGLDVTVLESLPVPLTRSVGSEVGQVCADLHLAYGTDLRCGVTVDHVQQERGHVSGVVLGDAAAIEADLVVAGIGVRPATQWLEGAGLALHEGDGGVLCDDRLRTNLPGVLAAGDVAHWPNPLFDGQVMRLEHWTNAAEHGAAAGANAVTPGDAAPVGGVPYFWSDLYDHRVQFVGISTAEEVLVVHREPFLALYSSGDRLVGTLTIDRPTQIMKFRRLIAQRATIQQGLELAGARG